MPRGSALGSVSGIFGMPVLEEKRPVMGTSLLKWYALERDEAVEDGLKVPVNRIPLA